MRARLDRIEHCNVMTACRRCASARMTRARARMEGQKKWDMRRTMMVFECGARMLLQLVLPTVALLCFLPVLQLSSPPPSLSSCDVTWQHQVTRHHRQHTSTIPPHTASGPAKALPVPVAQGAHEAPASQQRAHAEYRQKNCKFLAGV
jgi:hypothetical protein